MRQHLFERILFSHSQTSSRNICSIVWHVRYVICEGKRKGYRNQHSNHIILRCLKKENSMVDMGEAKSCVDESGATSTLWSAWNKSQFRHSLDFHLDSCRDKHTFFRVSFPAHKLGFCCWWSRKENICWKDWSICYINKLKNLRTLRVI